jgi:hypothetical protein
MPGICQEKAGGSGRKRHRRPHAAQAVNVLNPVSKKSGAKQSLPRRAGAVQRGLNFSSPAPGRPKVHWSFGIDPALVREEWGTTGEFPYEESELRPEERAFLVTMNKRLPRAVRRWPLGETKKLVVYERSHPEMRLVLMLGPTYELNGEKWQPILRSSIERDRGVDHMESREREGRLRNEICRVERRGRPRGPGKPKRSWRRDIPDEELNYEPLKRAGLSDRDIKIHYLQLTKNSLREVGEALVPRMTPQGVHRRLKHIIWPVTDTLGLKRKKQTLEGGHLANPHTTIDEPSWKPESARADLREAQGEELMPFARFDKETLRFVCWQCDWRGKTLPGIEAHLETAHPKRLRNSQTANKQR